MPPPDDSARPRLEPYLALALLFLSLCALAPVTGHYSDMQWFRAWILRIQDVGLPAVYDAQEQVQVDYPPLWLYFLAILGKVLPDPESVERHLYAYKLIALAFDFAMCAALMALLRRRGLPPERALLLAASPAFLYDTLIWGQVDAIHTALALGAAIAALERATVASLVLALLACNAKLQTVAFLPVLAVVLAPQIAAAPRSLAKAAAIGIPLQIGIIAPFLFTGRLDKLIAVTTGSVDRYPFISLNAYNFWHLIYGSVDLRWASDRETFLGLTLKSVGATLYFANLGAILWLTWRGMRREPAAAGAPPSFERNEAAGRIFLALGLAQLAFFLFPTQMHERYCVPALPFLAAHAFLSGEWRIYAAVSVAQLLNLEGVLRHLPGLDALAGTLMHPRLCATLFLSAYGYGMWLLRRP